MKFEMEYKSDMHNNYMIIKANEKQTSSYGLNMLINNKIPGLLKLELRVIDNTSQYYYDITSRQSILWALEKGNLSKEQVKNLMISLIHIVDISKEYLLDENDFVLEPEYIFVNLSNQELSLCYAVGYQKDIRIQISAVIEYLMNKVDHREEGAALLIYSLYKVSKEDNYTFEQLLIMLEEKENTIQKANSSLFQNQEQGMIKKEVFMQEIPMQEVIKQETKKQELVSLNKHPTSRKEKIESEEEVKGYSNKSILYSGISIIITISIFIGAAKVGLVYNKSTNGLDYSKAFALLFIVGGIEAYTLVKILEEKNKIMKIQKKVEYLEVEKEPACYNTFYKENMEQMEQQSIVESDNTVVLSEISPKESLRLTPLDKSKYQDIYLREFPFFIGALKMKVDYSIENQTISRFHAKLEKIAEQFYITDLNSTNGTYINQIRLGINEKKQLQLEDEVSFADVRYRFTVF